MLLCWVSLCWVSWSHAEYTTHAKNYSTLSYYYITAVKSLTVHAQKLFSLFSLSLSQFNTSLWRQKMRRFKVMASLTRFLIGNFRKFFPHIFKNFSLKGEHLFWLPVSYLINILLFPLSDDFTWKKLFIDFITVLNFQL
jgi:hypothetical protein